MSEKERKTPTMVRITVDLAITDEATFWAYALRRHQETWQAKLSETYEEGPTIVDAAMEVLVISNENPENTSIGFEIAQWKGEIVTGQPMTYDEARTLTGLE